MPKIILRRSPEALWLWEFSFNGKKWYSIHDKNVVLIPPYELLREKLNRLLSGAAETEVFDGYYCRETKTLALSEAA
ncbi:hypothetical protein G4O51_12055 [Candidatus Bathyarchaeota archaeon A05DMB-2]|jgi:hypothetical protein|nr:hypothetical protein [Candidatus Bathyarchaeota archaeon A05DMB-2]